MGSLPETGLFLGVFVKVKSSLNDHIGSNLDGSMPMSRRRQRTFALWLAPCHDLQVQHVQIVEVLFSVGAAEYENLCLCDQDGGVSVSGGWGTNTFWTLKPGHCDWVKGVEVSENFTFGTSTAEDNDFGTGQDC